MKLAAAMTAVLGTAAGGIGMLLPDASAPYLIGHVVINQLHPAEVTNTVSTYAAVTPMKEEALRDWVARLPYREDGTHIVVLYGEGHPVPDPSGATSLAQADWIASSGPAEWRVVRQGATVVSVHAGEASRSPATLPPPF